MLNGLNEYDGSPTHYCFDFDVKLNKHGNIEVVIDKTPSYFSSFSRSKKYVFAKSGKCISHPSSKKYRHHEVNAVLMDNA